MYRYLVSGLMAVVASPALAGGIERSPQSMNILFQQGNYVELGVTHAHPRVSGDVYGLGLFPSGNVARAFTAGSLAFKGNISDTLSYAIILDQPFGADTLYPDPAGSPLAGASGKVDNTILTGVLRYKFDSGFSAHGGLRSSWTKGSVGLPPILPISLADPYAMTTNTDQAFGYLVGVAYEKPEIALRVALTYNSSIKHTFTPSETLGGTAVPTNPVFNVKLPESLNLEFQTGVANDTLVFGSVRWVKWQDFAIPAPRLSTTLVAYPKNSMTYTLGVGRRFNENWSGSVSLAYDTGNGNPTSNLGPTGNRLTLGLGASYTIDNVTISGGMQYARIGNATTTLGSQFTKNSAIGAGIRIGYRF